MFLRKNIKIPTTRNDNIVEMEKDGWGRGLVQKHQTYIEDQEVRNRIMKMSHLEVIA